MLELTATAKAIENTRSLQWREMQGLEDEAVRAHLLAAVSAGVGVPAINERDGQPEEFVWVRAPECGPPWGCAIVRRRRVITVLRCDTATRLLKKARRPLSDSSLTREEARDPAVLLRFRARGIPGLAAFEVMRDGTARPVLTALLHEELEPARDGAS